MDSSSQQILGFNWPELLFNFIQDQSHTFNNNKYRSAIFYLNYSARQMRGMSVDIDSSIGRKLTLFRNKLKNLDKYPMAQNFHIESDISSSKSKSLKQKTEEKVNLNDKYEELKTEGDYDINVPRQISDVTHNKKNSDLQTGMQKTENSLLSQIFQDVNRIRNIEDFNAPLSNIDKILQSLLIQMRANLHEFDHPINIIVKKFSDIILWNVNQKKNQLQRTSKQFSNQTPLFEVVDNPDIVSDLKTQDLNTEDRSKLKSIKLSTAKIKKNLRATYDRQTLQQLPAEIQFAQVVIAEVKKFICILYGALIRFYISVMRFEDLHEMREDLIELLTSLSVRGDLSKLLIQLCRLVTNEEETILSFKYRELKDIKPEDIGINKLFTLNKSSHLVTLFYEQQENQQLIQGDVGGSQFQGFEKLNADPRFGNSEKKQSNLEQFNPLIQREEEQEYYRSKSCILTEQYCRGVSKDQKQQRKTSKPHQIIITSQNCAQFLSKEFLLNRIQNKPYMQAIQNLRKLKEYETPIDKMRCLTQTSKLVVKEIDNFWRDINLIQKKKLTLDADELLMIFIYVTLRSKLNDFYAHLKLINEFSTDTLRQSKLGYYTSTMEVALSEVLNLDREKLKPLECNLSLIQNAQQMIEENIRESLQSDFPLLAEEDFDVLDKYDTIQLKQDNENIKISRNSDEQMVFDNIGGHYLKE